MSIRVGVIGAGTIGRTHLAAYREAGAVITGVTDVDRASAERAAAEFGTTAHDDLAALLDSGVQAVSVCTPPAGHAGPAIAALRAGVAVLCEKPLARTEAECTEMITAARAGGALLTVGFCHRFQPEVEAIRDAIEAGRIGTVLGFRNRFSGPLDRVESSWFARPEVSGGGVLMDTCVHSVDLFRHLIGEVGDVRALTATTATDRGPALAVEDSAVLSLRSAAGVLGVIEASWRTAPGEAVITISGTRGRLHFDYAAPRLTLTDDAGTETVLDVPAGNRFVRQAGHFLDCVAGRAEPRVTAEDGARAVAVLGQAYSDDHQATKGPR